MRNLSATVVETFDKANVPPPDASGLELYRQRVLDILQARPEISTGDQQDADFARLTVLVEQSGLVEWVMTGENPIWRDAIREGRHTTTSSPLDTGAEIVRQFGAFILSAAAVELLCFLKTVPEMAAEELICWMLQHERLGYTGSRCYKGYPNRTEHMYETSLRVGMRCPDPSSPRDFIRACAYHKGSLGVFRDLTAVILSNQETEQDIGGALQALYWVGATDWPLLEEFDAYKASPEQYAHDWNEQYLRALDANKLAASIGLDSPQAREKLMQSKPGHCKAWDTLTRDDVAEAESVWCSLIPGCVEIFLDETRSHALRKQAFYQIPLSPTAKRRHLLDDVTRDRLDETIRAARVFPDEHIQSVISPKATKGKVPPLMSVTTPLTMRTRLTILLRRIKHSLFGR